MKSRVHADHGQVNRFDGVRYFPEDLIIRGEHDRSDPLRDPRIDLPVPTALLDSIRKHGPHGTIEVRKNGKFEDGPRQGQWRIELVDGQFRTRGTRIINKERAEQNLAPYPIQCLVKVYTDEQVLEKRQFMNVGRTIDDPVTIAINAQNRIDRFGHSKHDIAIDNGVTVKQLEQYLLLLHLHPDVRLAVRTGVFSATAALELRNLQQDKQVAAMNDILAKGIAQGKEALAGAKDATSNTRPPKSQVVRKKTLSGKKILEMNSAIEDATARNKSADVVLGAVRATFEFVARDLTREQYAERLKSLGIELPEDDADKKEAG